MNAGLYYKHKQSGASTTLFVFSFLSVYASGFQFQLAMFQ